MAPITCDAGMALTSSIGPSYAIVGIVHKRKIWRIPIRAKTSTIAELLAVILARRICGEGVIFTDNQSVASMLRNRRPLTNVVKTDDYQQTVYNVTVRGGVRWIRRRSTVEAEIADTVTHRKLSQEYVKTLIKAGYELRNYVN